MTTGLILPLLIGAIILGGVWVFHEQNKAKKAVVGHIFPSFWTDTGAMYMTLCKVDGKKVEAPVQASAKYPKVKSYVVSSDHTFGTLYPPGRPKFLQAVVQSTVYYEGNPNPQVSRDRKEGPPDPLMTGELLTDFKNEQAGMVLTQVIREVMEKEGKAKQSPMLLGILLLVVVLSAVSIYVGVAVSSQLASLARLWGL